MANDILVRCITKVMELIEEQVCTNISFHAQADFVEISENRDEKFPAIIIRGPKMIEDLDMRIVDTGGTVDKVTGKFSKKKKPKIVDTSFKIILISEGDMEGLETIGKLVIFFAENNQITVLESDTDTEGKIYNITLTNPIEESGTANISDLTRYEGTFVIEGVEFVSSENIAGKIVQEVNLNVKQKTI